MEELNHATGVNQEQESLARKPWQTPVVEELPVNETATTTTGGGNDINSYS